MIYEFLNRSPEYDDSVFIAPSADLIGDVTIGSESSIWFRAVVRGDVNWISIGEQSNIQDGCCIHVTNRTCPVRIGDRVTIGHGAIIHGCTIGEDVLAGIGTTILDRALIEPNVMIAAGSLVPPGARLESGFLYMGTPARKKRELTSAERESIGDHATNYVSYARAYKQLDTYQENPFYDATDRP